MVDENNKLVHGSVGKERIMRMNICFLILKEDTTEKVTLIRIMQL